MPRRPRFDAPGMCHHVMNRGARRQPIFLDDGHCAEFLALLSELPDRFDLRVHGYALMPNHYHMMLESRRGDLSRGMAFVQSRYSLLVNRHHGWDGPLFRERFRSKPITDLQHWRHLLLYLHLNPLRARLVMTADQARWTSHRAYLDREQLCDWLTTEQLLALHGGRSGYRQHLARLHRRGLGAPEDFERACLFGSERQRSERPAPVFQSTGPEPGGSIEELLALAAHRVRVEVPELLDASSSRMAARLRRALAWWLVHEQGLRASQVAQLLGLSRGRISQMLRNAAPGSRSEELAEAIEQLCGLSVKSKL